MLNVREGRVVSINVGCVDLWGFSNCLLWFLVISGSFIAAAFGASSACKFGNGTENSVRQPFFFLWIIPKHVQLP